jgi:hypothetical protein
MNDQVRPCNGKRKEFLLGEEWKRRRIKGPGAEIGRGGITGPM